MKVNDSLMAKIGCNVYVMSYCDRFWHDTRNIFVFLDFSIKYLQIVTLRRNLASPMSVLERLQNTIVAKFSVLDLHGPNQTLL